MTGCELECSIAYMGVIIIKVKIGNRGLRYQLYPYQIRYVAIRPIISTIVWRRPVMSRINPDPHQEGYVYQPIEAVTAFFTAGHDLQEMLDALSKAGFGKDEVDVFMGKQGSAQLDLSGDKHGAWTRFMRNLEFAFADEADVLHRADLVLKSGGSVVAVRTDGDSTQKENAAGILNAYHGQEVTYWGPLVQERI
jgi:hypothetical protein